MLKFYKNLTVIATNKPIIKQLYKPTNNEEKNTLLFTFLTS
jgi:hypothetical protein